MSPSSVTLRFPPVKYPSFHLFAVNAFNAHALLRASPSKTRVPYIPPPLPPVDMNETSLLDDTIYR